MVFAAVVSVLPAAFVVFQRWVAGRVATLTEQIRKHAGLPPGSSLSGYMIGRRWTDLILKESFRGAKGDANRTRGDRRTDVGQLFQVADSPNENRHQT
jgi:hypothetical protein